MKIVNARATFALRIGVMCTALFTTAVPASAHTPLSPRKYDAMLEVLIRHVLVKDGVSTCVLLDIEDDSDVYYLNRELVRRLRRSGVEVGSGDADPECAPGASVLQVGPVDRDLSRSVRVLAGRIPTSMAGRPAYTVKRNWFGRWKVTGFWPAE